MLSAYTQWSIGSESQAILVDGYVGSNADFTANAGQSGVSIAFPKASALFYGKVKDSSGNPLAGVPISPNDNNNNFDAQALSDPNGYYVVGVLGGLSSDPWQVQVGNHNSLTNDIFSEPDFDNNGGTNLAPGEVVQVKFTALTATNFISGTLKDGGGNPISGVSLYATATINGASFNVNSQGTDGGGNYSFQVANGTWSVGVNSCYSCGNGLPPGYFPPNNQTVVISNNNGTANFTARMRPTPFPGRSRTTTAIRLSASAFPPART